MQGVVARLKLFVAVTMLLTGGCGGTRSDIAPVENFELSRYLGQWYEIARLDHSFERGLSHVTATYTLRSDGGVRVINRGYSAQQQRWREAEGKAYFVERPDLGYLKVSFFGPFYGAYLIFELDRENYHYALVTGPDNSYLWILARTPQLPPSQLEALVTRAAQKGFATDKLIFVEHGLGQERKNAGE